MTPYLLGPLSQATAVFVVDTVLSLRTVSLAMQTGDCQYVLLSFLLGSHKALSQTSSQHQHLTMLSAFFLWTSII